MHLFAPIISNLESIITHGGYPIILLFSVLEGLPLIGSAIPGHTVVVFSGFLVRLGVLSLAPVVVLAMGGAVLGDIIGYYIGKRYGIGFITRFGKHFYIKDEHIARAREVIDKHTVKALIFGRFNPITRPLTPFLIGASGVHIRRFWIYEMFAGVLWATSSVMLGYIFGASYHIVAGYIGKSLVWGILISFLIIWSYRFINARWHIFVRYDLFILIINILSLYLFFKMIEDTIAQESFMTAVDVSINTWMAVHTSSIVVTGTKLISTLGSPIVLGLCMVIGTIVYALYHRWRRAMLCALSLSSVVFVVGFVKDIIMRVRPENALIAYSDYSFPSLHAAMAGAACILMVYLFASKIPRTIPREIAIAGIVMVSFVIALSRIYLNVHWFSDVIAGYALGVCMTTLSILFVKYMAALILGDTWGKPHK